jgi:hypothetical protein|eukprot:COSAG06_NODE_3515_length_5238_cov_29.717984_7_plen_114_part_00
MSSDEASSDAGAAEEVDPDLAAMWQRFQHLTDKLSASNERSDAIKTELQQPKKREPHTPAHFPSLELNELVPDSAAGAEHVDAVLASASDLESSNAVLPALLSLDALFEVHIQ